MTLTDALVSIIVPTYNREAWLKEAVESLVHQTYSPLEIIVVDDCSRVEATRTLAEFGKEVHIIRNTRNLGQSASINRGLREARGEFAGILNDDDVYCAHKIARQMEIFAQHPEVDLVYADFDLITPDKGTCKYSPGKRRKLMRGRLAPETFAALLKGNFIDAITPLARKKCFDVCNGFDEKLGSVEDWDMWLRMSGAGFRFYYLDEVLVLGRIHTGRKSRNPFRDKRGRLRVLFKAFASPAGTKNRHIRKHAYATVFYDFANAIYKRNITRRCAQCYALALRLDPGRMTTKILRRMISSCLRYRFSPAHAK
ncbi:MAG: glycosyltransferase [Chitinivibrionales bacterium]|nr:glycosyltransferase [Chitinivibrionales bacterium]